MMIKIEIKKIKTCFDWRVKLKRIINFTKKPIKKIRNQNNEDQIRKHNIVNLNWKITLKTNKFLQKSQWKKLEI